MSNEVFVDVLSKLEKIKLSYRERLSTHGWKMVQLVSHEKKFVDFIKMWRQHFLDTMHPQSVPLFWQNCPDIYESFGLSAPTEEEIVAAL